MNKVLSAQLKINLILQELEAETNRVVEDISINKLDMTNLVDKEPVILRGSRIILSRKPGENWEQ